MPPVCEICDADLDPATGGGGLVTFQPDDRSREWRQRAAEERGFVGHPPDTGWFCAAHIDAARQVARTLPFPEGMRTLRAGVAAGPATNGDFAPDLVGVQLGSGRLVTSDPPDLRWVEWTLVPTDAHTFASSLRSALPALLEAVGLAAAATLEQRTERHWNPMDGAQPPWCPFTDTTFDSGLDADGEPIELQVVLNHWNEDEVADASVSLTIGDRMSVRAFTTSAGNGRDVDTLRLRRPTTAAAIAAVATLVH